ncbi:PadR family transcriptional regulator [Chondrinema litorale]|uniref:PadR family transcriptional regulator n=1 Tax=Chondrinema litorale TaxID=2994555 RepID=UPI002542CFE6|nr:helix-turn-helix transcriptional regulator [Chondrinema litorale]UZR97672.1 helix-turn-helix transcriptional regulator [Chondrinema litorale]
MENLGNLEESVLLIVMILDDAYGVSVSEAYEEKTGNTISIPAIHTVLKRLETKGMVKSKMGESTSERGGRRKRLYEATPYGYKVISHIKENRLQLWSLIPKLGLNNG